MDKFSGRIVLIGKNSFIGKKILTDLIKKEINCIALGRDNLDLTLSSANLKLEEMLNEGDTVIAISAIVPCKSIEDLHKNIMIAENLFKAFSAVKLRQIVNVSSDAVYPDSDSPINEDFLPSPSTIHGLMHFSRELIINGLKNVPVCHVRPTAVFGLNDPHNSYGPNRFIKEALNNQSITIFGEGKELRDFISISEVASLVTRIVFKKSSGVYNAVSGKSVSFLEIAQAISSMSKIPINKLPQSLGNTINNRREFNANKTHLEFPLIFQDDPINLILNLYQDLTKNRNS